MRRTARLGKGIAMRLKSEKAQFDLRAQEIDRLSQWLEAKLSTLAVRREDRIRIRLLTEELARLSADPDLVGKRYDRFRRIRS